MSEFRFENLRAWFNGEQLPVADWQIERATPAIGDRLDGAKITEWIEDETSFGWVAKFESQYDPGAWISADKWDACVDDGNRTLRCGHCGTATEFNVRDRDVLCECGSTYLTSL